MFDEKKTLRCPNLMFWKMCRLCVVLSMLVATATLQYSSAEPEAVKPAHQDPEAFVKFVKRFNPVEVFHKADEIDKNKSLSLSEYTDLIYKGLDSSEELLKLKVQNGNPRVLAVSSRRQESIKDRYTNTFKPGPGLSIYSKDRFLYRDRLYELMKQAIYQARNKMVVMQLIRRKRHVKKMFKMGYIVGKTDTAVKIFNKVGLHVWKQCGLVHWTRSDWYYKYSMYDIMISHMRMLHLWFQAELLSDLLIKNDVKYHEAYSVKGRWNFTE